MNTLRTLMIADLRRIDLALMERQGFLSYKRGINLELSNGVTYTMDAQDVVQVHDITIRKNQLSAVRELRILLNVHSGLAREALFILIQKNFECEFTDQKTVSIPEINYDKMTDGDLFDMFKNKFSGYCAPYA